MLCKIDHVHLQAAQLTQNVREPTVAVGTHEQSHAGYNVRQDLHIKT